MAKYYPSVHSEYAKYIVPGCYTGEPMKHEEDDNSCPECGGRGYVEYDSCDERGEYEGEEEECMTCYGSGVLEEEQDDEDS